MITANVKLVSIVKLKSTGVVRPFCVKAISNDKCWSAVSSNSSGGVSAQYVLTLEEVLLTDGVAVM